MKQLTPEEVLEIFDNSIKDKIILMEKCDNAGEILEKAFEKTTNQKCAKGATADFGEVEIKSAKNTDREEGRKITLAGMSIYDAQSRNKLLRSALNGRKTLMFSIKRKRTIQDIHYYLTVDEENKKIQFHIEDETGKNKLEQEVFIEFSKIQERINNKLQTILYVNYDFLDETAQEVIFKKAIIVSYNLESFLKDVCEGKITFEMRTRGRSLPFTARTRSIYIVDHIICS